MDTIIETMYFNFHGINVPVEVRQTEEGKYVFFNEKTKQYRTAFRRSLKRHLITHNKQRAKAKALLLMNCKFRNLLWEQQITLLEDNMDDDTPCVYWME